MDTKRFDTITRALVPTGSRRTLMRTALAGLSIAALSHIGLAPVAAGTCRKPGQACNKLRRCCGKNKCRGKVCRCPGTKVTCQGKCIDLRTNRNFCGQCANGQCPAGAICANADCGLTCDVVGAACANPLSECVCSNRLDPAHRNQRVCAGLRGLPCDTAKACTTDASCAPATLGFRQVCVSGLCPGATVCARPCT